ncbi:MAG: chemotaxis response regulator protein-glutamate methylesterase [Acidobacteria bacterium]|nr:chemotaxis response regulator protein-glutamate methylesterase [Acidobacteriota bacterium]
MRVLIVDDSVLFRRVLTDVLSSMPEVDVVGTAANGKVGLQKARELKPDLLTLDIEMPEMDGLAVLDALKCKEEQRVEVIVLSAVTTRAGDLTMQALQHGAFDFIVKPDSSNPEQGRQALALQLAPRIRALAHRLEIRSILRSGAPRETSLSQSMHPRVDAHGSSSELSQVSTRMHRLTNPKKPDLVLIGVSTGGPVALSQLLPRIPADLGVPVLIVQHMPPVFTKSLADSLSERCAIRIHEAVHGEPIRPNEVYIAPGGRQMRLEMERGGQPLIEVTDDPPENNCKPAVDYLFRSVANRFPGRAMAVILTGMGNDGTLGVRLLKRRGCFVIAQDAPSCVVYGMPKSAVEAGAVDVVLPLSEIADRITSVVRG